MNVLYVAWQDPEGRSWFPVGRLSNENGEYRFVYTRGAEEAPRFVPFLRMEDMRVEYKSQELFPLFANRLLSKARPEYKDFLDWVNVQPSEATPFVLLARTGGIRGTDSLTVFPRPERRDDGSYCMHFFCHGIRYLPEGTIELVNSLVPGTRLFLMPDPQNPTDSFAIALRTDDPKTLVGYVPGYFTEDVHYLLKTNRPDTLKVSVEKVNREAPIQLRLLCNMITHWPEGFRPCSGWLYEPLA